MILIGYARVSTINQNEDRQIQELIKVWSGGKAYLHR